MCREWSAHAHTQYDGRRDATPARIKERANAAAGARKQLSKRTLKTVVENVGGEGAKKEAEEEDGDEGDEGEEGAKDEKAAADDGDKDPETPPDLTCSICQLLYLDPQVLPCGHFFCHECILDTWQVTAKMSCPTCGEPCWKKQLKPMPSLVSKVDEYKKEHGITD